MHNLFVHLKLILDYQDKKSYTEYCTQDFVHSTFKTKMYAR